MRAKPRGLGRHFRIRWLFQRDRTFPRSMNKVPPVSGRDLPVVEEKGPRRFLAEIAAARWIKPFADCDGGVAARRTRIGLCRAQPFD